MKNKTLFISIVLGLGFLVGAKDALIYLFGDSIGIKVVAGITLAYSVASLILKSPIYDSGNWMHGWKIKYIALNLAMLIPTIIGTVQVWGADNNVELHAGLLLFMSKFVVICNLVIVALNSDWTALKNQFSSGDATGV